MLCFGGTKNGMAVGDAVLFFHPQQAEGFDYRCKQAGQLASKMRFLSAPWVRMLQNNVWLKNGQHGNNCALAFANLIAGLPQVELIFPVQANAVFLRLPQSLQTSLRNRGWRFYTFIGGGARFMFSWDADMQRVEQLAADIKAIALARH